MKDKKIEIRCPRANCNSDNIEQLQYENDLYMPSSYCVCLDCGVEFSVWYDPSTIIEAGME